MTAPFTARRAVERIVADVERIERMILASGMPVTAARRDLLIAGQVKDALAELPRDAVVYFIAQAIEAEAAERAQ